MSIYDPFPFSIFNFQFSTFNFQLNKKYPDSFDLNKIVSNFLTVIT
jgi:hypothetical protein